MVIPQVDDGRSSSSSRNVWFRSRTDWRGNSTADNVAQTAGKTVKNRRPSVSHLRLVYTNAMLEFNSR